MPLPSCSSLLLPCCSAAAALLLIPFKPLPPPVLPSAPAAVLCCSFVHKLTHMSPQFPGVSQCRSLSRPRSPPFCAASPQAGPLPLQKWAWDLRWACSPTPPWPHSSHGEGDALVVAGRQAAAQQPVQGGPVVALEQAEVEGGTWQVEAHRPAAWAAAQRPQASAMSGSHGSQPRCPP